MVVVLDPIGAVKTKGGSRSQQDLDLKSKLATIINEKEVMDTLGSKIIFQPDVRNRKRLCIIFMVTRIETSKFGGNVNPRRSVELEQRSPWRRDLRHMF